MSLSRRSFVSGACAAAAPLFPIAGACASVEQAGLRAKAAEAGRLYGCAVSSDILQKDAEFADAVRREAGIIVPEWELKRGMFQKTMGRWDWSGGDRLRAFAFRSGLKMRGHTLAWYYGNPDWLVAELQASPRESLLTDAITRACTRYRGAIHSWDVVNEAVEPKQDGPGGLRVDSPWFQAFGEEYIDLAFHAAREADPQALLFYGDYNVESDSRADAARRTAVLKLLERLKRRGAPLDAFGIQGHLRAYGPEFDEEVFASFLGELAGLGLKIMVTELDVADIGGPADPARRDADVAALTRSFADVALSRSETLGILTWGLSDRYSWLSRYPDYRWPDGQLSRGLPLDGGLSRKAMWRALADSFGAAPVVATTDAVK